MTVAAGVASPGTSFAFTDMLDGIVEQIKVVIPRGHNNLTGIRVYYANAQVIPHLGAQYLSGDDRTFTFEVDDFPTGKGWGGLAFNDDKYAHTFRMLFSIRELADESPLQLPPLVLLPLET